MFVIDSTTLAPLPITPSTTTGIALCIGVMVIPGTNCRHPFMTYGDEAGASESLRPSEAVVRAAREEMEKGKVLVRVWEVDYISCQRYDTIVYQIIGTWYWYLPGRGSLGAT